MSLRPTYILLTLATLAACSPGDEVTGVVPDPPSAEPQPICFGVGDVEGSTTRANDKRPLTTTLLPEKGYHFGLFAAYTGKNDFNAYETDTEVPVPVVGNFIKNVEFLYDKTNNYWYGNPRCYWPLSDGLGNPQKLSFFAYAPYDQSKQISLDTYENGPLKLDFTVGPVSTQYDFCVAKPLLDRVYYPFAEAPTNYYNLDFKHTLTEIKFFARYAPDGDLKGGLTVQIDSMVLKNVIGHKVLTYNADVITTPNTEKPWEDVFSWSSDDDAKDEEDNSDWRNYSLTKGELMREKLINEGTATPAIITRYQNLGLAVDNYFVQQQLAPGYMYLLPQTLKKKTPSVEITFSIYNGTECLTVLSKEIPLPTKRKDTHGDLVDYEWLPGHTVCYYIELDLTYLTAITATIQAETFMGPSISSGPDSETGNSQHYE